MEQQGAAPLHSHGGRHETAGYSTSMDPTPAHSGTVSPDVDTREPNPFRDSGAATPSQHASYAGNPFTSPDQSRPASTSYRSSKSSNSTGTKTEDRGLGYFHSRLVKKGEIEKPWLEKRDPKEKWVTILPVVAILLGLTVSGILIWDGVRSVVRHKYCPVMDETFSGGLDSSIWTKEVEVGGFGNGEFQQTTGGDENVFVENGHLVIKATLQDENLMGKNNVINLLKDKTCTGNSWKQCVAATNTTAGNSSVVPPTKSGRINTKKGASIKYGRVEVTAKLPEGDWLWPAIWMMPVQDTYGEWPQSGEIDIMESRGNNYTYAQGGNNIVSSALHWGPNTANDAWWKTNNKRKALHTTYSQKFHTFGLEWSQKYLFTYINTRLLQVTYVNFNKPLWDRGGFPDIDSNGTRLENPWGQTGRLNTPFDEKFYLILNVAVGGINGWFEDSKSGKPWFDTSPNAKKDFWEARDKWYPTWKQPQMEVKRVVMLQQCDGNEEL